MAFQLASLEENGVVHIWVRYKSYIYRNKREKRVHTTDSQVVKMSSLE